MADDSLGQLQPRRNILDFAVFVSFFPQLVAGPIERAARFLPQLEQVRRWSWAALFPALELIVGGYLKKGLWAGFAAKYPCANDLVTNINFTGPMIDEAAALVDVDGLDYDAAAAAWIAKNKTVVDGWMPACTM